MSDSMDQMRSQFFVNGKFVMPDLNYDEFEGSEHLNKIIIDLHSPNELGALWATWKNVAAVMSGDILIKNPFSKASMANPKCFVLDPAFQINSIVNLLKICLISVTQLSLTPVDKNMMSAIFTWAPLHILDKFDSKVFDTPVLRNIESINVDLEGLLTRANDSPLNSIENSIESSIVTILEKLNVREGHEDDESLKLVVQELFHSCSPDKMASLIDLLKKLSEWGPVTIAGLCLLHWRLMVKDPIRHLSNLQGAGSVATMKAYGITDPYITSEGAALFHTILKTRTFQVGVLGVAMCTVRGASQNAMLRLFGIRWSLFNQQITKVLMELLTDNISLKGTLSMFSNENKSLLPKKSYITCLVYCTQSEITNINDFADVGLPNLSDADKKLGMFARIFSPDFLSWMSIRNNPIFGSYLVGINHNRTGEVTQNLPKWFKKDAYNQGVHAYDLLRMESNKPKASDTAAVKALKFYMSDLAEQGSRAINIQPRAIPRHNTEPGHSTTSTSLPSAPRLPTVLEAGNDPLLDL